MATHLCVYFDDGGPDPVCACGERALLLTDEHGHEVLVILDGPVGAGLVLDGAREGSVQEGSVLEELATSV